MTLTLETAPDRASYMAALLDLPVSSPLQGWGYGEARKELGQEPVRYLVRQGGRTVGAVQLMRKTLAPGVSTLYAPRGPVLADRMLLPEFARAVRSVARRSDHFLTIEPPEPIFAGDSPEQEDLAAEQAVIPDRIGPFRRARTEQPEHTILIDTRPDPETIFAGLHKMARRNVRTSERMGVQAGRDDSFEDFWEIFTATNERSSLGAFPRRYYETLLREADQDGGEAYLLLSRHEGRALAGGFFLGLGDTTTYLYGGSVRDDRPPSEGEKRKDAKAPDAFYWSAIRDAHETGYAQLDLWGIPRLLDEKKHSFGVLRMKLKFGSQRYWYPAYDLALSPLSSPLRAALKVRRSYLNYRSFGTTDDIL
ncbi:lipid II:glycine glycyltransferase FemX [Serinicoccus sediminis]|uniref:lipid II:glycine glycyltransferase FemX n=1 Tax=Serinicoccus sediminis TaxID=2306021 RepID=UPI00102144B9|nr:peptidoglycan bridge formation glycyltransferase FemA/FemB family protein [Serinicoccus sediminis]